MKITNIDGMSIQITNNVKMIHYDRTDISEGIDVNKANVSKECDVCRD